MDTVSGRLLLLRDTAPLLLSIMGTGVAPERMLEEISNRYGVEAGTQARDFVARLTELGVLSSRDIAGSSLEAKRRSALRTGHPISRRRLLSSMMT